MDGDNYESLPIYYNTGHPRNNAPAYYSPSVHVPLDGGYPNGSRSAGSQRQTYDEPRRRPVDDIEGQSLHQSQPQQQAASGFSSNNPQKMSFYPSSVTTSYQQQQTMERPPQAQLDREPSSIATTTPTTGSSAYDYTDPYSSVRSSATPSLYAPGVLSSRPNTGHASSSTPNTPNTYAPPQHYYSPQPQSQLRKALGFRRVRDPRDLRPLLHATMPSSLKALTTTLSSTYNICNPQFSYESSTNPRRVLTKPSKPAHNEGYDNDDYDYILYVNDLLGSEDGHKYLILDVLGQGTFGQVVKCQNIKSHEIVAVKVVKNKPAYFNQSMMEVTILEMLNKDHDPHDEHHILRLRDSFIHKNHLCLVFELLSSNLYELIKQNSFSGLSTQLVKVFTAQLLDALTVLKDARLIHCDLKPENILLKSLQSPQIKIIDFGSACHEKQTVYTYIQSRFYRSPEVLLGVPYTAAIDMWSLGCIAVELFLGLPLFPGTSEYNQITRIVEMLGLPPQHMLDVGKQTSQFFDAFLDGYGRKRYQLKPLEKYAREHNTQEQPGKKYFTHTTLPEIIKAAPIPAQRAKPHEAEKEQYSRLAFIDFVHGLLNLNPLERWTPQQARMHPFITGEKFTGSFVPPGALPRGSTVPPPHSGVDPKRPYGGLVPAQPKGTRAFADAASYNQQLNQHQAFTQAQAAQQQQPGYRNPYLGGAPEAVPVTMANDPYGSAVQPPASSSYAPQQPPAVATTQRLQHHHSSGGSAHGHYSSVPPQASGPSSTAVPPSSYASYHPAGGHGSRGRSNTTNQMDIVPPAIARIANMGLDVSSGIGARNTLTPVLNRDDAIREWERRQQGGGKGATQQQSNQPLEYLQQAAERMPAGSWGRSGGSLYNKQAATTTAPAAIVQHYGASGQYPPPPAAAVVIDSLQQDQRPGGLRDVMNPIRAGAGGQQQDTTIGTISTPPAAYSGTTRYAPPASYPSQAQQPSLTQATSGGYDGYSSTGGNEAQMYVPLQPSQYQAAPPALNTTSQYQPPPAPNQYQTTTQSSTQYQPPDSANPYQAAPPSMYPAARAPVTGSTAPQRQGTISSMASSSSNNSASFYAPGVSPQPPPSQVQQQPQQQRPIYASQVPPGPGQGLNGNGRMNEMDVWTR